MDLSVPCGRFYINYRQDKAIIRSKVQWLLFIAFIILMIFLPALLSGSWIGLVNRMGISIIAVLGLAVLTGYTGQISLGQSAFMGIGAYACAVMAGKIGLPFWLVIPSAGLVTGLIGIGFGLPAVRIKGFYLVIATMAAHYIFNFAILHLPSAWTGREQGILVPVATLGGMTLNTEVKIYYLIMFCLALSLFFVKNLSRTRVGRAFVAIRDNDLAAQAIGVNLTGYKVMSFFICSFYAGVAGALWGYYVRLVGLEQFQVWFSVWFLGMLIIGGMHSIMGVIFGVVFLKFLEEMAIIGGPFLNHIFPEIGAGIVFSSVNIIYGLSIALFLIFEPKGIAHRWELFKAYYRLFPYRY